MDVRIALAGNPNSGKTTLFNALTGSNQYVGNWPGVTVEKKEGRADIHGKPVTVVDLPGIYSLSPYSMEEIVARDFIIGESPDAIINIVDATNLERNLYLTVQLLELERPMVMALNFMDEVEKSGDRIDVERLSPSMMFSVAPAATTIKRFHAFWLLKARGFSDSSSSPSIETKPPMGKSRHEYCVSPFLRFRIAGPMPMEYSFT